MLSVKEDMRILPLGCQGRLRIEGVIFIGFFTVSFRETHKEGESIEHDINELLEKEGTCFREGLRVEKF